MTKTEGAAAGSDVQAKVTGVKKLLAHFKKKLSTAKKQVNVFLAAWPVDCCCPRSCLQSCGVFNPTPD